MRKAPRIAGLAGCVLALLAAAAWPAPPRPTRPGAIVALYCRLDEAGARLAPKSAAARQINGLVSWNFEPHWHEFVVIDGYRLEEPKNWGGTTSIYVDYRVAGKIENGRWIAKPGNERQRFDVIDEGNEIFIYRPIQPPHIGHAAARALLRKFGRRTGAARERGLGLN